MRAKYGLPLKWLNEVALSQADDCIEWPFGVSVKGYGSVRVGDRTMPAHRYICLRVWGAPPSAKHTDIAHSCANRRCCNPRHLRHATSQENAIERRVHERARAA